MLDKVLLGYLSLFLVVLSGAPYLVSILSHKTRPHVFTHIIWTLAAGLAAAAQYASHAGPGAWAAALTALFSLVTVLLAFTHGERTITHSDWAAFVLGLSGIPLWYYTSDPLAAAIAATLTDAFAYYPTFRKSHLKPNEEMIFSYVVSNAKHAASLFAMTEYSPTTLLYPVALFVMNTALIAMLAWRRSRIRLYTARH